MMKGVFETLCFFAGHLFLRSGVLSSGMIAVPVVIEQRGD